MIQKTVNAEAKTNLKSSIMIWDIDSSYLKDYYLSQNTSIKMQTQGLTTKKSKPKESRLRNSKLANNNTLALPYINRSEKISH